jgi:hypothetical protein
MNNEQSEHQPLPGCKHAAVSGPSGSLTLEAKYGAG